MENYTYYTLELSTKTFELEVIEHTIEEGKNHMKIKWKLGIPKKDGWYLCHNRSYTLSGPSLCRIVTDEKRREIIGKGVGIFPVNRWRGHEVYFSQILEGVK